MLLVQAAADVDYRTFFLESVMTHGMHETMARAQWKLRHFAPLGGGSEAAVQNGEIAASDETVATA